MRQQLVHSNVRFSAEHMEVIRRHFNAAQPDVGNSSAAANCKIEKDERLLLDGLGKCVEWLLRDWGIDTEPLLPEWRALAAYFAFTCGILMILGIYLLPYQ